MASLPPSPACPPWAGTSQEGCSASARLFALCAGSREDWVGTVQPGWESCLRFCFQTSEPFNLHWGWRGWGAGFSESTGNTPLPIEMRLGGKERPRVAVLGFSFSGELELGSFYYWGERLKSKEVGVIPRESHSLQVA